MRTRLVAQTITALLAFFVYSLAPILLLGDLRSNTPLLVLRLNTKHWPIQLLNFSGSSHCFMNFTSFFPNHLPYGMIIWVLHTFQSIISWILVPNILMLIFILSVIELRLRAFLSSKDQVANIFTKPQVSSQFSHLWSSLTMVPLQDSLEGNNHNTTLASSSASLGDVQPTQQ